MIVLIANTSSLFFPIFSLNQKNYTNPSAMLFIFFHIILSVISAVLTVQICSIIRTVHIFHSNMNLIIFSIISQWFELFLAKIIIFPYQLGVITMGDKNIEYNLWVITSSNDSIPFENNNNKIIPMFVYGIIFLHYGFTLVFSVLILTCERAFATYFISDYEKKPRSFISISLLFSMHLITLTMAFTATFQTVHFSTGVVICFVVIIGAVCVSYTLNNLQNVLVNFQAKENERSLILARRIVMFAAFAVLSGISLLCLVVFNVVDNHVTLIVLFADTVFNLNPLFVIPLGLFSVPLWRDKFIQSTPFLKNVRIAQPKIETDITNHPKPSEVYFNQLTEAWK